jgi:outer membrane lipoprotein-sorting protein
MLLAGGATLARAGAAAPADSAQALVQRMAQANPNLESYTATLHVAIAMHSLPYLSPSLDGNYYFKRPDKQAIVFNTVPVLAQQFQRVYPKMDPPATWPQRYNITSLSSTPTTTTLRLTPKEQGRVTHVDVVVDDTTAMPSSFKWSYADGSSVWFDQQYARVGGNYLVKSQTGKVEFPSYNADVTTTFSDFKLNVAVPDTVFSG